MFKLFLVIAVATLGLASTASAQVGWQVQAAAPPAQQGRTLTVQLKDTEGFSDEDFQRYQAAQIGASIAGVLAEKTGKLEDALNAKFLQKIADTDYVAGQLVFVGNSLGARLQGQPGNGIFPDINDEIGLWAHFLTLFATAVIETDFARIDIADSRHFAECYGLPGATLTSQADCVSAIRAEQSQAQDIAEHNRQILNGLLDGGKVDLAAVRQLLE